MVNRILVDNGLSKALKVAKAVRAKLVAHGFLVPVAPATAGVRGVIFKPGTPTDRAIGPGRLEKGAEDMLDALLGARRRAG